MADPIFELRKRVWDIATKQFVAQPHCGICTNRSAVFSHMLPEVIDAKFECESRVNLKCEKRIDDGTCKCLDSWA